MTFPSYSQQGTSAQFTSVTSVAVDVPATLVDGEIAFLRCLISTINETVSWPSGWTACDVSGNNGQETQGIDFVSALAWRRMLASEGGSSYTINFSGPGSTGVARTFTFIDCVEAGIPYEDIHVQKGTSTTPATAALTTYGRDRLGIMVTTYDRATVRTANPSGSGWAEQITGGANNTRHYLDAKQIASPTTEGSVSSTITSDEWVVWNMALLGPSRRRIIIA